MRFILLAILSSACAAYAGNVDDAFADAVSSALKVELLGSAIPGGARPSLYSSDSQVEIKRAASLFAFVDPAVLGRDEDLLVVSCFCVHEHIVVFHLPGEKTVQVGLGHRFRHAVPSVPLVLPAVTVFELTPKGQSLVRRFVSQKERQANKPVTQRRAADAPQRG